MHTRKWKHISVELNEFSKPEGKHVIGTQDQETEHSAKWAQAKVPPFTCKIPACHELIKTNRFQDTK